MTRGHWRGVLVSAVVAGWITSIIPIAVLWGVDPDILGDWAPQPSAVAQSWADLLRSIQSMAFTTPGWLIAYALVLIPTLWLQPRTPFGVGARLVAGVLAVVPWLILGIVGLLTYFPSGLALYVAYPDLAEEHRGPWTRFDHPWWYTASPLIAAFAGALAYVAITWFLAPPRPLPGPAEEAA